MLKLLTRPTSTLTRKATNTQPKSTVLVVFRAMSSDNPAARTNEELKPTTLFDVSKCTAIVTGGGSGIGLMITQALVANGAKVYITGRREEALNKVVETYNTGPGKIMALRGDISDKADIERSAKEMGSKESKGIHLLANNAGIAGDDNSQFSKTGRPDFSSAQAISEYLTQSQPEQCAETFQTNVTAQSFMAAAFLPLLAKGREVTPDYTTSIVI